MTPAATTRAAGTTSPARVTPRAVLAGAVALALLLIVLVVAVSALTAPEAPEPVTMGPALSPVTRLPVRAGTAGPAAPKPAPRSPARAPAARPGPTRVPVEDATGRAYESGMDMARHAAGGGPWSGFIP